MSKIYSQLQKVQINLVAPKSNYNTFGKYNYRSCEDILNAVKPLLEENNLVLTLTDEVVMIGSRFYIKATAKITNEEGEGIVTTAYAREEDTKKGMDASQITGAASSYARKYALNGLFCIDDTEDADATNTGKTESTQKKEQIPQEGLHCSQCGAEITQAVKTYSEKKFGKALCLDCQKGNTAQPKTEQKEDTITPAQAKRMFAIAEGNKELVKEVLDTFGYKNSSEIKKAEYEDICNIIVSALNHQKETE